MRVLPYIPLALGVLISAFSCDVGEAVMDEETIDSPQVKEVFGENLPEESLHRKIENRSPNLLIINNLFVIYILITNIILT